MALHINTIRRRANLIKRVRDIEGLASLLKIAPDKLILQSQKLHYRVYEMKKKSGGIRLIEDPNDDLKKILRELNDYFQCAYYQLRPPCVYGFCYSTGDEEERNIVSNARRHMKNEFMLNIDLTDFFHFVSSQMVYQIIETYFPEFDKELTGLISKLCCYKGRLPMGSPTSPVLSNFAMLDLDFELINFSKSYSLTYTRFADDLSFSGSEPIGSDFEKLIRDAITHYSYQINERKVKRYLPADQKTVTGIIVEYDQLRLEDNYLDQLSKEIERYHNTMLVENRYLTGMSYKKLELLEQELAGKINFARMVMGDTDRVLILDQALVKAMNPDDDFESINWLEIPYNF